MALESGLSVSADHLNQRRKGFFPDLPGIEVVAVDETGVFPACVPNRKNRFTSESRGGGSIHVRRDAFKI